MQALSDKTKAWLGAFSSEFFPTVISSIFILVFKSWKWIKITKHFFTIRIIITHTFSLWQFIKWHCSGFLVCFFFFLQMYIKSFVAIWSGEGDEWNNFAINKKRNSLRSRSSRASPDKTFLSIDKFRENVIWLGTCDTFFCIHNTFLPNKQNWKQKNSLIQTL